MSPADANRRRFILLSSLRWVGTGCVIPTLVVLMQSRGLTLAQIGVAAAAQGVLVLLLELPTGGLADTLGPRRVLLASGAIESLALVLFIGAESPRCSPWRGSRACRGPGSGPPRPGTSTGPSA